MKHTLVWLLIGSAVLLTACGQKGPLYLPETTPAIDSQTNTDATDAQISTNPSDY